MVILTIDIGNTNIKYKCWKDGAVLCTGSIKPAEIGSLYGTILTEMPARVVIANVGSVAINDAIKCLFPEAELQVIQSAAYCLGVQNAYEQAERLGVDRWLAMIEAYHLSGKQACAIFDLGTALTLDIVDADGVHQGGFIAPGLSMMRSALLQSTERVRYLPKHSASLEYGKNTVDAVENGTLSLVLAWVEVQTKIFQKANPAGQIYITGGLLHLIAPFIPKNVHCHQDLVLDALKRIASS